MRKFNHYRFRTATSAELKKFNFERNKQVMPPRSPLAVVAVVEDWNPVKVIIDGNIIEISDWVSGFVEVVNWMIVNYEDRLARFVADMDISWLYKKRNCHTTDLSLKNDWFANANVTESVLIARLKMIVSGIVPVSMASIIFCFPNDITEESNHDEIPTVNNAIETVDNSPPPILDEAQLRFVNSNARNARLIAPAGAGKTLTILHRCKELIARDRNSRILLVTFTRAARDELKIRLSMRPEFAGMLAHVVVTTLNQYGFKTIKKNFPSCRLITNKNEKRFLLGNQLRIVANKSIPISKNINVRNWATKYSPRIIDLIDSFKTIGMNHQLIKNRKSFENWSAMILQSELRDLYLGQIGKLVDMKLLPSCNIAEIPAKKIYDAFIKFHCAACEVLMGMNYFTLEDQKYWGWLLLRKAARVNGAARYTQIFIDEFQDINPIDREFVVAIAKQHNADLTLVGDDDQTIFEWRGATPSYILNPDDYFGGVNSGGQFETFILGKNYRSPKNIVNMSQKLIKRNEHRIDKDVIPVQEGEAYIQVVQDADYDHIAQMVIDDNVNNDIKSIAVISRKRSQLIPYQIIFASKKVKFYAAEDLNVFLTDAFRALRNLVLIKTRQTRHHISTTDIIDDIILLLDHVHRYPMNRKDKSILRDYLITGYYQMYEGAVETLKPLSEGKRISKLDGEAIDALTAFFKTQTAEDMLNCVDKYFDGFQQDYQKSDDDIFYSDPPFAELAAFSRRYGGDFEKFYQDVELAVDTLASVIQVADDNDEVSSESKQAFKTKLHLMTALRTKGREFDSVFLLQANMDVWPIRKAVQKGRIEAERRLFYVAVTRAKKRLIFTKGTGAESPFLKEMGIKVVRDKSLHMRNGVST